jgi:hypothetical protein
MFHDIVVHRPGPDMPLRVIRATTREAQDWLYDERGIHKEDTEVIVITALLCGFKVRETTYESAGDPSNTHCECGAPYDPKRGGYRCAQ